jgi:hypothetical protein
MCKYPTIFELWFEVFNTCIEGKLEVLNQTWKKARNIENEGA